MLTSEIDEFAKERVSQVTRVGKFVDVRSFDQLTAVELERWRELRQSTDGYIPPFFSPVFSEAVHQSRGDVSVAVIHDADQITGFLPFHSYRGVALPAGRFFNDAHNVIGIPTRKLIGSGYCAKSIVKHSTFMPWLGSVNRNSALLATGPSSLFMQTLVTTPTHS